MKLNLSIESIDTQTMDVVSAYLRKKMNEKQLKQYHSEGYLRLDNLIPDVDFSNIEKEFSRLIHQAVDGIHISYESDNQTVRGILGWQRARGVLRKLAYHKAILDRVKEVLGNSIEFHQTKYNPKAPCGKGKKWDPHRGDTYWHYKDGIPDSSKIMTVLIAVTDQTDENGALMAWKGSQKISIEDITPHLIGLKENTHSAKDLEEYLPLLISPEKLEDIDQKYPKVSLTGPAGTVWLMQSGTLHASMPNHGSKMRGLIANVFRTTDNCPLHPREIYLGEPPNGPL